MDQMSPRINGILKNPESILLALELLLALDLKGCEALFPITIGSDTFKQSHRERKDPFTSSKVDFLS